VKHTVSIFRAEVAMLGSGGIYIGLEEGKNEGVGPLSHFRPEDGDSMFLRNVDIYLRDYTAPKRRRTATSIMTATEQTVCLEFS
jgi:hypothetical protein